jgi:redox-sensitive bicupin YhaK (pirin superfamily)
VDAAAVEVIESRTTEVGGVPVRRALPRRAHRTIGAWCFLDHFGPTAPLDAVGMQIGPHPHIGLQTVTWLRQGEVLHTDSLGTEQVIRPGQLNLMTAGHGIAHAEVSTARDPAGTHGAQLWVALPPATRHGPPAFEHHAELPRLDLGAATATVLVGAVDGARSPARADTPLVGVELDLRPGAATVPLDPRFEHGVVVLDGTVALAGHDLRPGRLAYVPAGRAELALRATEAAHVLVVGGVPEPEPILMWWNFVARTWDEVAAARADWEAVSDRYGEVRSTAARVPAPPI